MSRILVDCDDVLIDLCSEWVKELNCLYDTDYTLNDVKDWDFAGMFQVDKENLLEPLAKKDIWVRCKPINESAKYLKLLQDEGNEIYIVTATDYRNFSIKIEHCIKKYFPFINTDNIIRCHNKGIIKADFLIDDNINNLLSGNYRKVLFSRPYNKSISNEKLDMNNVIRVNSWKECYDAINGCAY